MTNGMRAAMAALLVAGLGATAEAQTLVTTRAGIGPGTTIDWSVLGPAYTVVPTGTTVSVGSGSVEIASSTGQPMERRNEGPSWYGNFATGDALLWTRGFNGPLSFYFSAPLTAFGSNIMSDYYGSFTGTLSFFDVANNLLGSVSRTGYADNTDGTAIFLGGTMNVAFSRVDVSVDHAGGYDHDFAINSVSVSDMGTSAVPEPATVVLMGTGLLALGVAARRRGRSPRR